MGESKSQSIEKEITKLLADYHRSPLYEKISAPLLDEYKKLPKKINSKLKKLHSSSLKDNYYWLDCNDVVFQKNLEILFSGYNASLAVKVTLPDFLLHQYSLFQSQYVNPSGYSDVAPRRSLNDAGFTYDEFLDKSTLKLLNTNRVSKLDFIKRKLEDLGYEIDHGDGRYYLKRISVKKKTIKPKEIKHFSDLFVKKEDWVYVKKALEENHYTKNGKWNGYNEEGLAPMRSLCGLYFYLKRHNYIEKVSIPGEGAVIARILSATFDINLSPQNYSNAKKALLEPPNLRDKDKRYIDQYNHFIKKLV